MMLSTNMEMTLANKNNNISRTFNKKQSHSNILFLVAVTLIAATSMVTPLVFGDSVAKAAVIDLPEMATCDGPACQVITDIHTIGQTIGDYTPVGKPDGMGAFELNDDTVRVLLNHELNSNTGSTYQVDDGLGGTFDLTGARISYFDISKDTRQIVDSGLSYNMIYNANGTIAFDTSLFANDLSGLSRLCSANLFEVHEFGGKHGFENRIYMTNEEDGGTSNPVGGAFWALDLENDNLWHVPDLGRGAWESSTQVDTNSKDTIALILANDSPPFDVDNDGEAESVPLYLYVGEKKPGDFLDQNGLRDGNLYVWVSDTGEKTPLDFRESGTLHGTWIQLDTSKGAPSEDGFTGFDEFGNPTQRNLWAQAEELGAFGFSRLEDVSTNPQNGRQVVLASTGVDTYAVDQVTGNGADTFGTIYLVDTNVKKLTAEITILYDGDSDPTRALRSPDNLDWADDKLIYIQEDEAEEYTLTGEPLFGLGATNPNEASIIRLDPKKGTIERIAEIDRSVILDPTTIGVPVDMDAGNVGEWESSGILDVSKLFGETNGTLFLFTVQAHGITNQEIINFDSQISNNDLVEGGQLLFLEIN